MSNKKVDIFPVLSDYYEVTAVPHTMVTSTVATSHTTVPINLGPVRSDSPGETDKPAGPQAPPVAPGT